MPITISTVGNRICREFTGYVDIYPSILGRAGIFLIHIHNTWVHQFAMDLHERNVHAAFRIVMKPCGKMRQGAFFLPKESVTKDDAMKLLDYLHDRKMPIKWGEGAFGYEIDRTGLIIRKWALAPAKLPAKSIDLPSS